MLRYLFAVIIFIHGLIHLMGFSKAFGYGNITQLTKNISKLNGVMWLIAAVLFILTTILFLLKKEGWPIIAFIAITISQVLIITEWKDARWGTAANIIILIVAVIAAANYTFNESVNKEVGQIFCEVPGGKPEIITEEMIALLPHPVKHWLQNSGVVGMEKIHSVRLKQKGLMRTKPDQEKWMSANAEQHITIDRPAFIWKVKMNLMPLITLTGRDKFADGKGDMTIKLLSLIPVAKEAGPKMDQAASQRWLGEICWFPSAALSPYITWQGIDSSRAKATLSYEGSAGSVTFHFNPEGEIVKFTADRYKENTPDAPLEKWLITVKKNTVFHNIKIPSELEVAWELKEGDFIWYKIKVTELDYNNAPLHEK